MFVTFFIRYNTHALVETFSLLPAVHCWFHSPSSRVSLNVALVAMYCLSEIKILFVFIVISVLLLIFGEARRRLVCLHLPALGNFAVLGTVSPLFFGQMLANAIHHTVVVKPNRQKITAHNDQKFP
jgi:hypothetical protein